jgi:fructose transport system permease protein
VARSGTLNHTAWGRHVYAVGDDPDAAELSGQSGSRACFSASIRCAGAHLRARWLGFIGRNRLGLSDLGGHSDYNLQSITAAVIGGISLFGGRGSILGTLFGALIVGVVSLGLNLHRSGPAVDLVS